MGRARTLGNKEQIATLEHNVQKAEEFYELFNPLHVPDNTIKDWIFAGAASQDDLKAKYDVVMKKKAECHLKFEMQDTRVLLKIRKWNEVAIDCRALTDTNKKTSFSPERLHEIDELIGTYKFLIKVPEVELVVKEFDEIKQWDAKI